MLDSLHDYLWYVLHEADQVDNPAARRRPRHQIHGPGQHLRRRCHCKWVPESSRQLNFQFCPLLGNDLQHFRPR